MTVLDFSDTEMEGDEGSTTVDVHFGEHKVANPISRIKLAAVNEEGKWLLDGFEFLGSPPPAPGTPILKVDAADYAFALDKQDVPGNVGFKFSNVGKEPQEIALFKGPAGTDVANAKTALENVNGQEFDNVPAGYQEDHIAFTPPGDSQDIVFLIPCLQEITF